MFSDLQLKNILIKAEILSSEKFVEPDHGCIRVRKQCKKGLGQSNTIEDFYRIPYKYISHYKVTDNDIYKKIKK